VGGVSLAAHPNHNNRIGVDRSDQIAFNDRSIALLSDALSALNAAAAAAP
jgi:hypothetical protein